VNYNFQSEFLLQNFIRCKKESIEAVEKLLEYLASDDLNKKRGTIRPTVTPLN